MQIGWVQGSEFRNYSSLSWKPAPSLNLLTGANAQGKTNLLEALGFLTVGRSFRTARLAELARWGAETVSVSGEIRCVQGVRVVRRILRQRETGGWQVVGDDCPWARAVAFGWQDLEVVHGPPAARRAFLDGFAARLYASHRATLLRFRQVLARRNRLLQQRLPESVLGTRLTPWDEQFAAVGGELIDRRRRATAALQTEIGRIYPGLTGERQKVEVRYRSTIGEAAAAGALLEALARTRRDERRRGQTVIGPHRDDLAIEVDGVDARVFGSRGQQRLLALGLRVAEVLPIREAVGSAPVLLLDDALSELDHRARANVLREIQGADQVFLTAPEPLAVAGAVHWTVQGGEIVAA